MCICMYRARDEDPDRWFFWSLGGLVGCCRRVGVRGCCGGRREAVRMSEARESQACDRPDLRAFARSLACSSTT